MIETENTPNPDTLKFLPGKKVSEVGPLEFLKDDKSIKIPLANKILSLEGTVMVFFGEDFITVKKEKNLNWNDLKHGIISEINEYYSKGNDAVIKKDEKKSTKTSTPNQSNEIVQMVQLLKLHFSSSLPKRIDCSNTSSDMSHFPSEALTLPITNSSINALTINM